MAWGSNNTFEVALKVIILLEATQHEQIKATLKIKQQKLKKALTESESAGQKSVIFLKFHSK